MPVLHVAQFKAIDAVARAVANKLIALIATAGALAILGACSTTASTPASTTWPAKVDVNALPNGIALRPSDDTIFMTDDRTSSVLSSTGGPFTPYASIPVAAGQGKSLSQVSVSDAGHVWVERFGFGTASAIFEISSNGTAAALSGPDGTRRRLGLLSIGTGQLLSTWFIKNGSSAPQGALSLVTYDEATHSAVERDLLTGLGKPVGVVVSGGDVFVSDQANNVIVKANLAALLSATTPATGAVFVHIQSPDLMAVDANGRLYTACNKTGVCEITPDGTITVLANDFQEPRGVAVDVTHHQLFAVDRAASATGTSYLRTIPLK
jgi:sugar lactone lactonase YvrE